jgi:hypothetical protein
MSGIWTFSWHATQLPSTTRGAFAMLQRPTPRRNISKYQHSQSCQLARFLSTRRRKPHPCHYPCVRGRVFAQIHANVAVPSLPISRRQIRSHPKKGCCVQIQGQGHSRPFSFPFAPGPLGLGARGSEWLDCVLVVVVGITA